MHIFRYISLDFLKFAFSIRVYPLNVTLFSQKFESTRNWRSCKCGMNFHAKDYPRIDCNSLENACL